MRSISGDLSSAAPGDTNAVRTPTTSSIRSMPFPPIALQAARPSLRDPRVPITRGARRLDRRLGVVHLGAYRNSRDVMPPAWAAGLNAVLTRTTTLFFVPGLSAADTSMSIGLGRS